jgi:hypothetical protein
MSKKNPLPFDELAHSIVNSSGPGITQQMRADLRRVLDDRALPVSTLYHYDHYLLTISTV